MRAQLGITAFGVNGYVASAAGYVIIDDHSEARTGFDELYVVPCGELDFSVEQDDGRDRTFPMCAGQLIYVEPHRGRTARARSADACVLVVGAVPGRPFVVSESERARLTG